MVNTEKNYKIAIDGMAGTGKSTLAKSIAKRLNIVHIDSGAMYRAVGYYFVTNNIEINEENAFKHMDKIVIDLKYIDGMNIVFLNSENITTKIRTEAISSAASKISAIGYVREKLVKMQQQFGDMQSVVMDGRDIASVVFKDADLKIYLETDITERAKRRQKDLQKIGEFLSIEEIIADLQERDKRDMTRKESPLIKVNDAVTIDTTYEDVDKITEKVVDMLAEKEIL